MERWNYTGIVKGRKVFETIRGNRSIGKTKRIDIVLRDLSKAGNPASAFFHNDAIFHGHVARKTS